MHPGSRLANLLARQPSTELSAEIRPRLNRLILLAVRGNGYAAVRRIFVTTTTTTKYNAGVHARVSFCQSVRFFSISKTGAQTTKKKCRPIADIFLIYIFQNWRRRLQPFTTMTGTMQWMLVICEGRKASSFLFLYFFGLQVYFLDQARVSNDVTFPSATKKSPASR